MPRLHSSGCYCSIANLCSSGSSHVVKGGLKLPRRQSENYDSPCGRSLVQTGSFSDHDGLSRVAIKTHRGVKARFSRTRRQLDRLKDASRTQAARICHKIPGAVTFFKVTGHEQYEVTSEVQVPLGACTAGCGRPTFIPKRKPHKGQSIQVVNTPLYPEFAMCRVRNSK